ncbi:MAG: glycosyltransferase [Alphaproteobacteria bacterium]|nr:glycosyltransferase [Alphaproteobacteria bacterium]
MQDKPKISVIIPIYNGEQYLTKCLESVINQTLKDIEIICINDGSTDNSLSVLQEYASKDDRIIIINKENEGQGIARNKGIEIAKGEYIGFVDPDDWIDINMYEKMYSQAILLSSEIVVCNLIKYQEYNNKLTKFHFHSKAKNSRQLINMDIETEKNIEKNIYNKTLLISPCYSWNRIYKRTLLVNNNIYFSKLKCYEDCIFILKSNLFAKNISFIKNEFYYYRLRDTSTLRAYNNRHKDLFITIKELRDFLMQQKNNLNQNLDFFSVMNVYYTYNNYDKKSRKILLKEASQYLSTRNLLDINLKILKDKYKEIKKYLKIFFNIKNTGDKRHKIITFLGVKLKVKNIKGVWKKEEKWFKKIIKNQKKYPKDTYLLFDCLSDKNTECIDAYSLFTYMKEHGYKTYYILLKDNVLYNKLKESNKLDNVIIINHPPKKAPDEFMETIYDILLRTKCILTSFGDGTNSAERFFRENKYWEYIFIQHGEIYLKECIMKNKYLSPKKFDKFLISSDKECQIFKQYGWPDYKLIKVGIPRWDLLSKDIQNNEKSILFMFTYRRLNQHQFDLSLYKKNLLSLLNNKDLQEYLKSKDIKIYFAPHHALKFVSGVNFNINNTNINIINTQEISKYIKQCSMLVTDFSSIVFDFMFQDKPVICYGLDLNDEMLEKLEAEDLKLLKIKQENFPNILFDEERVINKIKHYVENDFNVEEENLKKYQKFFYTKENIREKLTKELEKICDNCTIEK